MFSLLQHYIKFLIIFNCLNDNSVIYNGSATKDVLKPLMKGDNPPSNRPSSLASSRCQLCLTVLTLRMKWLTCVRKSQATFRKTHQKAQVGLGRSFYTNLCLYASQLYTGYHPRYQVRRRSVSKFWFIRASKIEPVHVESGFIRKHLGHL